MDIFTGICHWLGIGLRYTNTPIELSTFSVTNINQCAKSRKYFWQDYDDT